MFKRAATAATTTAAVLLLAAGPALADDDFIGPHHSPCDHQKLTFLDIVVPMFAAAKKAGCALADTDEPAEAHLWVEAPTGWARTPFISILPGR